MVRTPPKPPLDGLKRQIDRHRRGEGTSRPFASPFVRETFCLDREAARAKAREWFESFPKQAYWTEVESWRILDGDRVEFTMRRLSSAD